MCVGIGGFENEIRGRAARGKEDFSNAVETNRNVETIRGRCMIVVKVCGGWETGRWGVGPLDYSAEEEGNQLPSLDGPQTAARIAGVTCRNGCPPHLSPLGVCRNLARSREPPPSPPTAS